jgi:hypothetical protein
MSTAPAQFVFVTRAQLAEHLTKNGFPIKLAYLNWLENQRSGPPVAHYWGQRPIYDLAECLTWARNRSTKRRPRQANKNNAA